MTILKSPPALIW